ncbi:hypothetical protein GGE16_006375, partial [Rhizobium leguminosarum]|nr:hypothetical protein [Rhizobium leguminosarum]MBB4312101.1 hypothetical protein [Rhizobium leguminosarum]MBB4533239.1 hypothetical protein [Rhizobium leguminosarum]MDF9823598.1 hypothetical protein [Rhizobium leguminosarum]
MAVIETAEKMLPAGLRPIGSRTLRMLAAVLTERGEKAAAQRMALTAFSIRILSAALAFVSQIVLARLMGEYEYGIFVFVWVLVVVFGDLSCLGYGMARPSEDIEYDVLFLKGKEQSHADFYLG